MQIFLVQVTVEKWPQDHYFFTKSAILPIFDPILQREGKKYLHFRYTTHITRTSRVWQAIWGADNFSTSYSRKMASGSLFFTKSALGGDP